MLARRSRASRGSGLDPQVGRRHVKLGHQDMLDFLHSAAEGRHHLEKLLNGLGLVAALRDLGTEFSDRTGVSVRLACGQLIARLPAGTEMALYRILQEALKNVEKHARARHVTVRLTQPGAFVQLVIKDDGIGFDPDHHPARQNGKGGLGLLSMHERVGCVGGTLKLKSVRHAGTEIEVRAPLPPRSTAALRTDL